MIFPPAARAVPHRHGDAFVYASVLEGGLRSASRICGLRRSMPLAGVFQQSADKFRVVVVDE